MSIPDGLGVCQYPENSDTTSAQELHCWQQTWLIEANAPEQIVFMGPLGVFLWIHYFYSQLHWAQSSALASCVGLYCPPVAKTGHCQTFILEVMQLHFSDSKNRPLFSSYIQTHKNNETLNKRPCSTNKTGASVLPARSDLRNDWLNSDELHFCCLMRPAQRERITCSNSPPFKNTISKWHVSPGNKTAQISSKVKNHKGYNQISSYR